MSDRILYAISVLFAAAVVAVFTLLAGPSEAVIRIPYARANATPTPTPAPTPGAFSISNYTPSSPSITEDSSGYGVYVYWGEASDAETYSLSVTPTSGSGWYLSNASQTGIEGTTAGFYISLSGYPSGVGLSVTVTAVNASGQSQATGYYYFSNYPAP